ncbi:MAG TPA: hypothetical protein VN523_06085 [Hyphomicrobiaceae bacterium]|jgi:hypothetical protein|nr:hypothetical protein [Hyphomicrobiaceae bacterium]
MRYLGIVISVLVCSLQPNLAVAQGRATTAEAAKVATATSTLVACIRHDIHKQSSTASAATSPLTVARSVEATCRSQLQEVERTSQREQGAAFDRMAFEREWRAAIAVGAQDVLTGASAHSLDLETGLKNGQTNKEFDRILLVNVKAKRLAAQTCLYSNIKKHAGPTQEPAEAVAHVAIVACKQDLDRLNQASCLQVTGNNCTIDLTKTNALQMHINEWGSSVTAAVASTRWEGQAPR